MNQKEEATELISKIIKDGCQLLLIWIKKRRSDLH